MSFFTYYKQDGDPRICPNELFVACTRASERLTLFHHYKNDWLPFLKKECIADFCQVEHYQDIQKETKEKETKEKETKETKLKDCTDLIR
jgi:hypothetical protein